MKYGESIICSFVQEAKDRLFYFNTSLGILTSLGVIVSRLYTVFSPAATP